MEITTVNINDINDIGVLLGFIAAMLGTIAYGGYRYGQLETQVNNCTADIKELDETAQAMNSTISEVKGVVTATQHQINNIEKGLDDIRGRL